MGSKALVGSDQAREGASAAEETEAGRVEGTVWAKVAEAETLGMLEGGCEEAAMAVDCEELATAAELLAGDLDLAEEDLDSESD